MKRINILFIFLTLFYAIPISSEGQPIKHPEKCNDPYSLSDLCTDYTVLSLHDMQQPPYNYIVHICVKKNGDKERFGTGSFIFENAIITAQHGVVGAPIEYIEIGAPTVKNATKWIRLKTTEFSIEKCEGFAESDLAIIKILNQKKLKDLYKGHFEIADSSFASSNECRSNFNVSGFPCILFSHKPNGSDTMLNRHFESGIHSIEGLVRSAYMPACTFPGDSGSPVWRRIDGKYYIGMMIIKRGSSDKRFQFTGGEKSTVGLLLYDSKINQWIKSVLHGPHSMSAFQ